MLWTNNPEIMKVLHDERVRQVRTGCTTRKPRLKLVAVDTAADAASVA